LDIKISKRQAYWILQLFGWTAWAMFNIFLLFFADIATLNRSIVIFILSGYYLISTHFFRYVVLKNNWLELSLIQLLPRVLLFSFILGISNYLVHIISSTLLETINTESDLDLMTMMGNLIYSVVAYVIWAAIYFIFHYFERYNASLKYDAIIYEIELNKLKSQLNPHFIFNALNSIRALVDEDPLKSKKAITQLSNILRNSLIMNKRKLIDFNDEIKTVKDYLDLEAIRLEERLDVDIDISPEAESYQIPPLMIQTLVENGIKHGVATLTKGGHISLKAWQEDDQLKIQIRNSGQYKNGIGINNTGYGLENTEQRLSLIFGKSASFKIANENNKTVLTEISIPQYY
jgi:sensor histidine kinase YesM